MKDDIIHTLYTKKIKLYYFSSFINMFRYVKAKIHEKAD
jgi:hypothetical protein